MQEISRRHALAGGIMIAAATGVGTASCADALAPAGIRHPGLKHAFFDDVVRLPRSSEERPS